MFEGEKIHKLAEDHSDILRTLAEIERQLAARFQDLEHAVEALVLSVASGEPLLFIGPPGTGKSRLIRAFCVLVGILRDGGQSEVGDYFEYLLTPFTEPGELFGFWNLKKAQEGLMERESSGMAQNAKVVYLDEVFNGSSAILNSILTFMNERVFHDRNRIVSVRMECLFGATNQVAETPELQALLDRFLIRCRLENVPGDPDSLQKLLVKGWADTYGPPLSVLPNVGGFFEALKRFREAINATQFTPLPRNDGAASVYGLLSQLVLSARHQNLSEMSNRRLVKLAYLMLIHRVYEGVKSGHQLAHYRAAPLTRRQFELLPRFFLDHDRDEQTIHRMLQVAKEAPEPK